MNKAQLIDRIANQNGIKHPKSVVASILDSLAAAATEALQMGEEVPLTGLGKLTPVFKPGRIARNPKTGASVEIEGATNVKFRVSSVLKKAVK